MHLAKGLEFKAVAVMACDDEVVPLQARIEAVGDESDLKEVYDTERHLLYVACTRARDYLHVSAVLLHGPEQIADLPVPVVESPGAVRIGHPERGHLVEYLAPNSVFNSLPRQRSCPHLGPDDRFVTIDRVLHHASLGAA